MIYLLFLDAERDYCSSLWQGGDVPLRIFGGRAGQMKDKRR